MKMQDASTRIIGKLIIVISVSSKREVLDTERRITYCGLDQTITADFSTVTS